MNIRSILHKSATAWAITLLAVADLSLSSCERGYEPPSIQSPDNPEVSDKPDIPDDPDNGDVTPSDSDEPDSSMPVKPAGKGSRSDPYNVSALRSMEDDEEDIWVEGYVTGFVSGPLFDTGIRYRLPQSDDGYEGRDIVIGCTPLTRKPSESAPVMLQGAFRRAYSLDVRPDLLGRHILINGATGGVLGVRGISDITILLLLEE